MVAVTLSTTTAKEAVVRLRAFLATHGIGLKQTNAYEALARTLGHRNWNVLQAQLSSTAADITTLSATGAKEAAARLREFLAANEISLDQAVAYEAVAQILGYQNGDVLQALLKAAGLPAAKAPELEPVKVKFWGVRGSFPSPEHPIYGGNTSCVEVSWGDTGLILDAGTGIRFCGNDYIRRKTHSAVVLLSHCHWDHITGLSFFAPIQTVGWKVRILAGHLADTGGIEAVFASAYGPGPGYPHPLKNWYATDISFEDFRAGEALTDLAPGTVVRTAPLNHPNGATGYRIETQGKVICYVTDTEHVPGEPDENVLKLITNADLVIYNASYTDDEFPSRVGWGHSTWQEGVRLCKAANAKRLAIFHHDPAHDDAFMARLEDEACRAWNGAVVARDNMVLALS